MYNKGIIMDDLIEKNMGLVKSIVDSFSPKNNTEREDLIDAGRIGLWKALKGFNHSKGNLTTYAWRPIRWSIVREIKKNKKHLSLDNINHPSCEKTDQLWEFYSIYTSEEEKKLLELRGQGYKLREIAKETNQSIMTVRQKIHNTLRKLREINGN